MWERPRTAQSWQGKKFFLVEKGWKKGKWEKVKENYWKIVEKEKEREKREEGKRLEKMEKGEKNEKKVEKGERKGRRRKEKGRRRGGKGRREGWETQKTTGAPEIGETRSFL